MSQSQRFIIVVCLSALALGACHQKPTTPQASAAANAPPKPALSFDQGLAQANAQQQPLIVDFHAPWCYSCYFMATNILTGADWAAVEKQSGVVEVEADSPDGAALMQKYGIKFLTSNLVLRGDGNALGRSEEHTSELLSLMRNMYD